MDTSSYSLVAVFGSAARAFAQGAGAWPNDIDVFYSGCSEEHARQLAASWAEGRGWSTIPLDIHAAEERYSPDGRVRAFGPLALDADDAATFVILEQLNCCVRRPIASGSLPRAIRVFALRGAWPATQWRERVSLAPSGDVYFGDGLTALRRAYSRLDSLQRDAAVSRYGDLIQILFDRDPTAAEIQELLESGGLPGSALPLTGIDWYHNPHTGAIRASLTHGSMPKFWMGADVGPIPEIK